MRQTKKKQYIVSHTNKRFQRMRVKSFVFLIYVSTLLFSLVCGWTLICAMISRKILAHKRTQKKKTTNRILFFNLFFEYWICVVVHYSALSLACYEFSTIWRCLSNTKLWSPIIVHLFLSLSLPSTFFGDVRNEKWQQHNMTYETTKYFWCLNTNHYSIWSLQVEAHC